MSKVIPHTANAVQLATTIKPGDNENLVLNQKGMSENFVEDAPKDGKVYARQDGKWVEVSVTPTVTPETPPVEQFFVVIKLGQDLGRRKTDV